MEWRMGPASLHSFEHDYCSHITGLSVYARKEYDGDQTDEINDRRYNVLQDQLEIYRKVGQAHFGLSQVIKLSPLIQDGLSWSIWLYKGTTVKYAFILPKLTGCYPDIGFQGMVHVSRDTPYMKLFETFLAKKYRLAVDSWGADPKFVDYAYAPIVQLIKDEVPDENDRRIYPYPVWGVEERVARIARSTLVAEFLVKEWAEHFSGMDEKELDQIAQSFKFENCLKRERLNAVLTEDAQR